MTAHAKKVQSYQQPTRNPLAGKPTAMDATSFMNNAFKEIQKYTRPMSEVLGGPGGTGMSETTGRSSYTEDAWLLAQFKGVDMSPNMSRPREAIALGPGMSELPQPHMPADAYALTLAKQSPFKEIATKQRNRFNLMSAPDSKASAKVNNVGHYGTDSWEFKGYTDSKLHTQGARKKDWVGVAAKGAGMADQTMIETLKYQKHASAVGVPPRAQKDNFMGKAAKIPVDERLLAEQRAMQEAISQSNQPQDTPFRGMPADS